MGPFDALSIVGSIWPRVLSLVLVVGFVFFPHDADAAFMWAVHVEAARITSILEHSLANMWNHACHARAAGCRR